MRTARRLMYGFWFVPGLTAIAIGALAVALVEVDRRLLGTGLPYLFDGSGSGAHSVLTTVATATATITGVVFSITIVTLQLASSQFSPRTLRGFLDDRVSQAIAGLFVGTFIYALLVLRVVRESTRDGEEFVPALAVTVGIVLGVLSLGMLLIFIHHTSTSMQAEAIAGRARRLADARIAELGGRDADVGAPPEQGRHGPVPDGAVASFAIRAQATGYVTRVDLAELQAALDPAAAVEVRVRPGDFVTARTVLARACSASDRWRLAVAVRSAVRLAEQPPPLDGLDEPLRRLADIAIRALSPGINDPDTAIACIHHLGAALADATVGTPPPRAVGCGGAGISVRPVQVEDLLDLALLPVARHALAEPDAVLALLRVLELVRVRASRTSNPDLLRAVDALSGSILGAALERAVLPRDRARLAAAVPRRRPIAGGGRREGRDHGR